MCSNTFTFAPNMFVLRKLFILYTKLYTEEAVVSTEIYPQ